MCRLLFDAESVPCAVELDHAILPWIANPVRENRGALLYLARVFERLRESVAIKDVIAENETNVRSAYEIGADPERNVASSVIGGLKNPAVQATSRKITPPIATPASVERTFDEVKTPSKRDRR